MNEMVEIEDPLKSYEECPGPVLLLAGPGTGKTFQLAHRVKFLVDSHGATPEDISVITFTSAAARNMRERLEEPDVALGAESQPAIITTMHSLGNAIIGSAPEELGLPSDYGVLTNPRIRQVLLQDAAYLVAGDREFSEDTDHCRRCGICDRDTSTSQCQICSKYVEILRKCSVVDYDDQILLACELLAMNEEVAAGWRSKARHLLVDEYQDINQAQFRLIQLLSQGQTDGLFVVGDDDQSIYSFRGGTPSYIQEFSSHFTGEIRIGRLSKSWRCPEHILRGAKNIIDAFYPDSVAKPEPTFANDVTHSERITFWDVPSDSWEGNIIAKEIQSLSAEDRIIIIVPNSKYFPAIRDALRKKGIPYRYKTAPSDDGIVRFAVLADWAENPHDSLSLRHIVDLIIQNHNDLVKSVTSDTTKIAEKRAQASNLLASLWDHCEIDTSLLEVITQKADGLQECSFHLKLKTHCLDQMLSLINEHGGKRARLPEFLEKSGLLLAPGRNARRVIDEIREWRNEVFDSGTGSTRTPVEIYNMPSSKGLEGHVVFVVGVTDGLMPNPHRDLEEQARLFYVAITRAKRKLHLFSSRSRPASITFKQGSYQMAPSPFAKTIPSAHLESKSIYPKKKGPQPKWETNGVAS
jgi:DNA helicase-2/ATP-dependent DNA helicase PcrA